MNIKDKIIKRNEKKEKTPKWVDKCPFCFNEDKEFRENGFFNCKNCKAQFYPETYPEVELRSRFRGSYGVYDPRKFPRTSE